MPRLRRSAPVDRDLEARLFEFETWVRGRPSAASTAQAYVIDLRTLHRRCGGMLTAPGLERFFAGPLSIARKNRVAQAYAAWGKFCKSRGVETPPIHYEDRAPPKRRRPTLEPAQYDALVQAAVAKGSRGHPVLLMLLAGLRRAEVRDANRGDVERAGDHVYLRVVGKGDKERRIPAEGRLRALLEVLAPVGGDPSLPLVTHGRGSERWRAPALYQLVAALGREHGLKLYPHRLRHGFANWLRWRGIDVRVIQEMLGHASIATTQKYLQMSDHDLDLVRRAMRSDA